MGTLNPLSIAESRDWAAALPRGEVARAGKVKVERFSEVDHVTSQEFARGWAASGHWAISVKVSAPKVPVQDFTIALGTGKGGEHHLYVNSGPGKIGHDTDLEIAGLRKGCVPLNFSAHLGVTEGGSGTATRQKAARLALLRLEAWGLKCLERSPQEVSALIEIGSNQNPLVVIAAVALAKRLAKQGIQHQEAKPKKARRAKAVGGGVPRSPDPEALTRALKSLLTPSMRKRVTREIASWTRDPYLRKRVEPYWGTACAACGSALESRSDGVWEYQVAHLKPVSEVRRVENEFEDVIPLCHTHHWALDELLWSVNPKTRRIVVAKRCKTNPALGNLMKKLGEPVSTYRGQLPGRKALSFHWKKFKALEK